MSFIIIRKQNMTTMNKRCCSHHAWQ